MDFPAIPSSITQEQLKEALKIMGFGENHQIVELTISPGCVEVEIMGHYTDNHGYNYHTLKIVLDNSRSTVLGNYPFIC